MQSVLDGTLLFLLNFHRYGVIMLICNCSVCIKPYYMMEGKFEMKLILSSCSFYNENSRKTILANLPKPIEECKVLFFPNERATIKDIRSQKFYLEMEYLGFDRYNIYVFDYYRPGYFSKINVDVIFISSGNTFSTLSRIQECRFDKFIHKFVKSGVTFIGGGAGAYLATTDISHVQNFDEYHEDLEEFKGFGFLDVSLICHYSDERKNVYDELKNKGERTVIPLTDDDAIVISLPDID